jgi:hypothetical protein
MLQPRSTSELLHINACGGLAGDTFVCFIIFVFETHLLWFYLFYIIKVCCVFGCKLCKSDLLSLCRMLEDTEGPTAGPNSGAKRRVQLEWRLLAALVDKWC